MATSSQEPKPKLTDKGFLQYAGMGFQLLAIIAAFLLLGRFIDSVLQWRFPFFTILLSLLGVSGGMYSFIRKL